MVLLQKVLNIYTILEILDLRVTNGIQFRQRT